MRKISLKFLTIVLVLSSFSGFVQDVWSAPVNSGKLYVTGGVRFNYWDFNNELLISPRATVSYYPAWKSKISFRLFRHSQDV